MSQRTHRSWAGAISLGVCVLVGTALAEDLARFVGEEALAKIRDAAPAAATAKPAKPRKVLVFTESARDLDNGRKNQGMKFVPHPSAPHCALAVALMGEKAGAYAATVTSDPAVFSADGLKDFDAIVLANVYLESRLFRVPSDLKPQEKPLYEARQKALLDFVSSGKGLVGVHNAACPALGWPEFNQMLGGTHGGHAWLAHQSVPIKLDDPKHPLNGAFGEAGFTAHDDIYSLTAPYTRDAVHVLLSVEADRAPASMAAERPDGDYPVSWARAQGGGRVFYTSLGHEPATFQDAKFLRHLLDGIQFALGDLPADASPGKPLPAKAGFAVMEGWTPLFDGKDLSAWQVNDEQKQHWLVEDGLIRYDGRAASLFTKQAFRDYTLRVDWRMPRTADSGVFVRDSRQLNIWTWAMGSGEMWEYRTSAKTDEDRKPYTPKTCEDRPVGEWNTFLVTVQDDRVTVFLNGKEVISQAELRGARKQSPIGLQQHGDPVEYKGIYIKELSEPK